MKKKPSMAYLILTAICLVIVVACIFFLAKYHAGNHENEDLYESLRISATAMPSPSPQRQEPSSEVKEDDIVTAPEIPTDLEILRKVDFESLQTETNADIYAWIYIPGTQIDYPVLQHPSDDAYYLNYNIDGSKGYPGCIYTEKENARDFSDFNTVIYGHNMRNGTMFHDLHSYEDETFLPDHPYVYIYLPDRTSRYQIFMAYRYDDRHLLYSFDYASEAGRNGYLSEILGIRSMSVVRNEQVEVTADDKIITLSTCVGNQAESRYLVQAKLINDIPVADINY